MQTTVRWVIITIVTVWHFSIYIILLNIIIIIIYLFQQRRTMK